MPTMKFQNGTKCYVRYHMKALSLDLKIPQDIEIEIIVQFGA